MEYDINKRKASTQFDDSWFFTDMVVIPLVVCTTMHHHVHRLFDAQTSRW